MISEIGFQPPTEKLNWIIACVDNFSIADQTLKIIHNDELLALAPLCQRKINGNLFFVSLGVDEIYEPTGAYCRNVNAAKLLSSELIKKGLPLKFQRIPDDGLFAEELSKLHFSDAVVFRRPVAGTPFIQLDTSWQTPEKKLNSGRQSDFRRAQRQAQKMGTMSVEIMTPKVDELDLLLDQAFLVEARGWKGKTRTALLHDSVRAKFYRDYGKLASNEGSLRISFLKINNVPVAMQISVLQGNGFWLLKIGHDSLYDKCSPGLLLLRETLIYAEKEGCKTFEFMGTDAPWIQAWTKKNRKASTIWVYPISFRGIIALLSHLVTWTRRRLIENQIY